MRSSIIPRVSVFAVAFFAAGYASAALVGHYAFDGNPNDSTAFNNHASITGTVSPTYVAGRFGQAVDLDGTDDAVRVPLAAQTSFGVSDFSVALWVNRDLDNTLEGLVDNNLNTNGGMLLILSPAAYGTNNRVRTALYQNGGGGSVIADSTTSGVVTASADWQHVAIVADRDQSDGLKIYIDGTPDSSHDPTSLNGLSITGTTANWAIGVLNESAFFNGQIDDLRFYDHALTGPEVAALIPEPSPLALAAFGLLGLLAWGRRIPPLDAAWAH